MNACKKTFHEQKTTTLFIAKYTMIICRKAIDFFKKKSFIFALHYKVIINNLVKHDNHCSTYPNKVKLMENIINQYWEFLL
jgi:hypothetical protein